MTTPVTAEGGDAPSPHDPFALELELAEALSRWPSAGVAVGVVRDGKLDWFLGHGVADIESTEPITPDTVFRIGSITKTMTAVAIMQLWEQGLVDLDAPANDYLRAFKLVPAKASFRSASVRHLLTHTAGIGYWRRLSDLLTPGVGSGDMAQSILPLADYYRHGLPVEVEPGTKWVYSNHGFAALGQIVEDVTGEPLDCYLRRRVFEPLGMANTDLTRSERVAPRLATGYVLRSRGFKPVPWHEIPTPAGGGVYSTTADLARYVATLLQVGTNEHGAVLEPETVESMFQPHFDPDPALPGMGLGFEPGEESGHNTVKKGGVVSGFLSAIVLVPDRGIGVIVLTNTGGLDKRGVAEPLADLLVRRLLGLRRDPIRTDIPVRAEHWNDLCGWYSPDRGPVTNLFVRALLGAGVEVAVRGGRLMLNPLTPVPAMRARLVLHPDDPNDPWVFRVEFPGFGTTSRVVFREVPGNARPSMRLMIDLMAFQKRPDVRNPRRWIQGAAAAGATALALRDVTRHRSS